MLDDPFPHSEQPVDSSFCAANRLDKSALGQVGLSDPFVQYRNQNPAVVSKPSDLVDHGRPTCLVGEGRRLHKGI